MPILKSFMSASRGFCNANVVSPVACRPGTGAPLGCASYGKSCRGQHDTPARVRGSVRDPAFRFRRRLRADGRSQPARPGRPRPRTQLGRRRGFNRNQQAVAIRRPKRLRPQAGTPESVRLWWKTLVQQVDCGTIAKARGRVGTPSTGDGLGHEPVKTKDGGGAGAACRQPETRSGQAASDRCDEPSPRPGHGSRCPRHRGRTRPAGQFARAWRAGLSSDPSAACCCRSRTAATTR